MRENKDEIKKKIVRSKQKIRLRFMGSIYYLCLIG